MKTILRNKLLRLIILGIGVISAFSCSHVPKNQIGKEKIILVHGFGRSPQAMNAFEEYFESSGYQVYSIGYRSLTQDIDGIKKEFYKKVDQHLLGLNEKVHFIGHSMGGLLVRSYLGERRVKNLGNVVILGSPNKGTPIVDYLKGKWYYSLAGPAVESLSSNGSDFLRSLKRPTYNLGVIAGYLSKDEYETFLPGKDDGVVPFESTKVEGMKDFLAMPESHYSMRYSLRVMKQVHYFLINKVFRS